jgi:GSH-dependent disulfide-bond oxidoreductase
MTEGFRMEKCVELYGSQTGNCIRAAIALEEAGIPFVVRHVDLALLEHREKSFLALNPAGKVPVMIDWVNGRPLVVAQSNAIILYAAERAPGRLLPSNDVAARAIAIERFFFFVTDVIAPNHAAFYLRNRRMDESLSVLNRRVIERIKEAERYVAGSIFMAGEQFTVADIVAYTIMASAKESIEWPELPNLARWFRNVGSRPAIQRGYRVFDPEPAAGVHDSS